VSGVHGLWASSRRTYSMPCGRSAPASIMTGRGLPTPFCILVTKNSSCRRPCLSQGSDRRRLLGLLGVGSPHGVKLVGQSGASIYLIEIMGSSTLPTPTKHDPELCLACAGLQGGYRYLNHNEFLIERGTQRLPPLSCRCQPLRSYRCTAWGVLGGRRRPAGGPPLKCM
jgi:hypothetical protein